MNQVVNVNVIVSVKVVIYGLRLRWIAFQWVWIMYPRVMLDASKRRLTLHESFLIIYFTGDRLGEQINVKNDLQTYRSIVNLRLSSSGQSKVIGTTSGQTSSISSSDNESTYLWWRVKLPWSASSWSHVHKIKTMSTNIWLVCCQTRD